MLLECIPNISAGRDLAAIDRLWEDLGRISDLHRLHRTSDPDHNRTVLTLAGTPGSLRQALHRMCEWAGEHIDLRQHQGVHPRIGALDVIPFVPLQDAPLQAAVDFSREVAAEIAAQWQVPIYLYEDSALVPGRQALPDIRRGGYEGLPDKMAQPEWRPDYGPAAPHPALGASVLGVRKLLIAFNVFLHSTDLELARRIARRLRARDGGFPALRALGFYLAHRQMIQISMNLLDFEQTSLFEILEAIRNMAGEHGVAVASTEFIGLVPRRALLESAWLWLGAEGGPVLERVLEEGLPGFPSL